MIEKEEINREAERQGLRFDQIEKDHVILWILFALSQPQLKPGGLGVQRRYLPAPLLLPELPFLGGHRLQL